jgi:peptidoglycan/LPS O-acetylase OafA/YrhL
MTEVARELTPAQRARRRYLIAVVTSWFFVDVFDGAVLPDEAVEHGAEAAFWAFAALGYVLLARLRPSAAEHRLGDVVLITGLVVLCVHSALRATLPDGTAFRWGMGVLAAYVFVVWLAVRRRANRTGLPANEPPAS